MGRIAIMHQRVKAAVRATQAAIAIAIAIAIAAQTLMKIARMPRV